MKFRFVVSYEQSTKKVKRVELLPLGILFIGLLLGIIVSEGERSSSSSRASAPAINTVSSIDKNLTPQVIDGVETWGSKEPLTQQQLSILITRLNRDFNLRGEKPAEAKYYMTAFLWASRYQTVPIDMNGETESPQTFFQRHAQAMSNLLNDANQYLTADAKLNGFTLRRLIIVQDGVRTPGSWDLSYAELGLNDSDGVWTIAEDPYDPRRFGGYDRAMKIDFTLLHEWGHRVLHLPDIYILDLPPPGRSNSNSANWPFGIDKQLLLEDKRSSTWINEFQPTFFSGTVFENIPLLWQGYTTSRRNDFFGNSLMNAVAHYLGPHEAWQLGRRVREGWSHNYLRAIRDYIRDFPKEVPDMVILDVGQEFAGAQFTLYRTEKQGDAKFLGSKPVFTGDIDLSGRMNIGNPFADIHVRDEDFNEEFVPSYNGVLFARVTTKDGQVFFRWMDVREFNVPNWYGLSDGVIISLKLASKEQFPSTFDWQTKYFTLEGKEIELFGKNESRPNPNEVIPTVQ